MVIRCRVLTKIIENRLIIYEIIISCNKIWVEGNITEVQMNITEPSKKYLFIS